MGKDYLKYYTPADISTALVNLLDFKNDCTVVDICCGSGNLLNAAKRTDKTLKCHGVDIIDVSGRNDVFCKSDGRAYALKNIGKFDYALANPPFGRSEPNDYTHKLFCGKYAAIVSSRIEVEFLVANLCVLKDSGVLLIILPSTIIEGTSTINVRRVLAKNHFVSSIIRLPLNSFAPERIKCCALIIQKKPNRARATTFYEMTEFFEIHKLRNISSADMNNGNWCDITFLNDLHFTIRQGKISSPYFCNNGIEVLHTGKRSENWHPTIRLAKLPAETNLIMAEDGDILISRIGASAGQKCIYHGPDRYISDCLLLIKSPDSILSQRIIGLDFLPLVTGLSTPHITAQSIYQLYAKTYE